MLKLKRIGIDTHRESIVYLNRGCTLYQPEEFQALAKIEVVGPGRQMPATLNIVDDPILLTPGELGLSEEAFRLFRMPEGTPVSIGHPRPLESLEAVRAKAQGHVLSAADYNAVIRDIAALRYSKMEIAAFLVACASFMTTEEVLNLTRAMAAVGHRLDWGDKWVVDKHCIGGIPGNRTSMIVVPLVMAHGLIIPKTSSRAITSPAGTADTMEVLARVDIETDEMRAIVERIGGCLIWGGYNDAIRRLMNLEGYGSAWDPPIPGTVKTAVLVVGLAVALQALSNLIADWNKAPEHHSADDIDEHEIENIRKTLEGDK